MFVVTIPTRPIITRFDGIDSTHYVLTVSQPQLIDLFTVALTEPLPSAELGIGIYLSLAPFTEFAYCGMMSNASPSAACWNVLRNQLSSAVSSMRIGLSVEPLQHLNTLVPEDVKQHAEVSNDAQLIAANLVQFIESWSSDPAFEKAVQRWYDKFSSKHRLNPFFYRKQANI